jgi:class 3 adenylate cyclase/tetratricopeptide (TPR) repeat protein
VSLVCGSCGATLSDDARFCSSCGAPTAGPARETRRVVTALFSDVVGSTALGERLDPEDFKTLVGGAVAHMGAAVDAFGGEVFEYAGDGLLALFGAPTAHEDDPERAVLAGLRIIESIESYRHEAAAEWDVEGFAVRVGIETGLAVLGPVGGGAKLEYGAVGDALNTAARLQTAAEPGAVLVGPRTHEATAGGFDFGEARGLTLKGKAGVVEARPVRGAAANGPAAGAIAADLVGREIELERGADAVDAVLAGSGRVVFVTGDAGVGKSRLVAELRRRFEAGESAGGAPRWLEGRCVSYGESLPYWPFRSLLREWLAGASEAATVPALRAELGRLAPERAGELQPSLEAVLGRAAEEGDTGAVPPEAAQQRIHDDVAAVLERLAAEGPVAISVDDLHWADASSLALLERLLALTDGAAVLIVLNARPERAHASWELRERALRTLPHRVGEISLEPLGDERAGALLAALVGGVSLPPALERRLLARAEGNPFYLEELVRSMIGSGSLRRTNGEWQFDRDVPVEIPETVEKVVLARIDRLTPRAQELVGVAAVLGRQFPVTLLEAVSREPALEDALRELQAAELVRDAERWPVPFYAFTHTLIQEAAYRGLLRRRRQELHAVSVSAVEELYGDRLDEFAGMAAYHAGAAGDHRKAFDYHLRAGRAAESVYALEEAVDQYAEALESARELGLDTGDGRVRGALASRGFIRFSRGELEPARQDLERAIAAAERAGDAELQVNAGIGLLGYWRVIDFAKATEMIEQIADVSEAVPPVPRVTALGRLAIQYVNQLRFDRAVEVADHALAVAESAGDPGAFVRALDAEKLVALQTGQLDRLEDLTGRLRGMLEQRLATEPQDASYYLSWVLLESAFVPLARGEFDSAIELISEGLELTRRIGVRFQEGLFIDALCWAHRSKGDFERALEYGREAVQLTESMGGPEWVGWTRATLGWAMLETGEIADAAECLELGLAAGRSARAPAQIVRNTALLGWARAELAETEAARALREECGGLLDGIRVPAGLAWLFGAHAYVAAARVDVMLGEPERAIALLGPIVAAAERSGWVEIVESASKVLDLAHARS